MNQGVIMGVARTTPLQKKKPTIKMSYEVGNQNGYRIAVGHIFKGDEIEPGSRWISTTNGIVTIEEVKLLNTSDGYEWHEVYYSWEVEGERYTHEKDSFSFQCRYCLILSN